jgi:hypothetical protein
MSEIQSIANGTYMIGETTQTEFQAGPGISITKPSEGTIRIANDDTVLWSGEVSSTAGQNLNYTITLSEAITNFEIIRVFLNDTYSDANKVFGLFDLNPLSPKKKEMLNDGSGRGVIVGYYAHCDDSTHLTYQCGFESNSWNAPYTGQYWGYGKPYKVVGINRIAGGNNE